MKQQQIPTHFTFGNIKYEVNYTITDTIADVTTRPVDIPGIGLPYVFDISNHSFIYHDLLSNDKSNTVFISALTTFLNNNVPLPG